MVKIGIIGLGRISGGHISALRHCPDAKITAVCDIDTEKLKNIGDQLGIPESHRFIDYHDLVACADVEAVEICTPNYLHTPMALAAVRAGKAVEVEKPLSNEYENGVADLIAEVENRQITAMMCFSYRFKPAVRYAKELIDSGKLGQILNVTVEYLQCGVFIPGRRLEWRFVKEYAGSGTLADLGVHLIDMTRFLAGDFESVYAMSKTVVHERQKLDSEEFAPVHVDDLTGLMARLKGGVIANMLFTKCAIGESNTIKFEIYGTDGKIKFNLNNPEEITLCFADESRVTGKEETITVPEQYRLGQEECYVKALHGEMTPYFPSVTEGAACQKVLDAAVTSAAEDRVVTL